MLQELASRINEPAEGDPAKLDLDDTLVVITSEFGRTPAQEDAHGGLGQFGRHRVGVGHAGMTPRGSDKPAVLAA